MLCNIRHMARGPSGRIVVEIDPGLKRELYAELARDGRTLKNWFTEEVRRYIQDAWQPALFVAEPRPRYQAASDAESEKEG